MEGVREGWRRTNTARAASNELSEEGNDLSNDPKQRVKLGCGNGTASPPAPPTKKKKKNHSF